MRTKIKKFFRSLILNNNIISYIYYELFIKLFKPDSYTADYYKYTKLSILLKSIVKIDTNMSKITIDSSSVYVETEEMIKINYQYLTDDEGIYGDGAHVIFNRNRKSCNSEIIIMKLLENIESFNYMDIGANVGYDYSLKVAKKFSNSKVIAIEANSNVFFSLKKNIELNKLDNIDFYNLAISDKSGTLFLNNAGAQSFIDTTASSNSLKISAYTLDEFLEANGYGSIDFLKVDIEGAEILFLRGAHKTISQFLPVMIIECLDVYLKRFNSSELEFLNLLKSYGYIIYKIKKTNDILCLNNIKHAKLKESLILDILEKER